MLVARNLSRSFNGKLRIAYSGGCDYFNIDKVVGSGIWPVTVATTILKPGGYQRFIEMSEKLEKPEIKAWSGIDVEALEKLVISITLSLLSRFQTEKLIRRFLTLIATWHLV